MTGQGADWSFWLIVIIAMGAFLFLPQIMARRRQKRREVDLNVGDSVVTIGGFIGELTYFDFEQNLARIKLAEGVECRIVPASIAGKRTEPDAEDAAQDDVG